MRIIVNQITLGSAVTFFLLVCPTSAPAQGGVPLWTNRYNEGGQSSATAIAADSAGNAFVAGYSSSTDGGYHYLTVGYSNAGVPLWTNRYYGEAAARGIAVDSKGNVFVTGGSSVGTNADFATVGYSNSGVPLWTNRYDGPANLMDSATAIAIDSSDNVIVTGASANWSADDCLFCFGDWGYATVAYSNSGVPLWTNRYEAGGSYGGPSRIAADRNGNVFVLAQSTIGSDNATADYQTLAYSSSGDLLWIGTYDGPRDLADFPAAIALHSNGTVFVTGGSSSGTLLDYATIAYSNEGVPLWTNRYRGSANLSAGGAEATAIAVDRSGNVFVTATQPVGGQNIDSVLIKYSSSVSLPRLDFQLLSNELVLSWTNAGFTLQAAPAVTGPFTNLPAAISPYTNSITAPQQFFRLISN